MGNYPASGLVRILKLFSKIPNTHYIKLVINEDVEIDLDNEYSAHSWYISGSGSIKIMNAPSLKYLNFENFRQAIIEKCLFISSIFGSCEFLQFNGPNSKHLSRVHGNYGHIIGLNKKIVSKDLYLLPKNKINFSGPVIIKRNQDHLLPENENLFGYRNIHLEIMENTLDLSNFVLDEVNNLTIIASYGNVYVQKVLLPKIDKIKLLKISCCIIQKTDFSKIREIERIVVHDFCKINPTYQEGMSRARELWEMMRDFPDILSELIAFGDIYYEEGKTTKLIASQDEYIANRETAVIKSARNV